MQRTKYIEPTAILCADIHLREDVPVCRTDDFEATQWNKLQEISSIQKQYNIPVFCSGDLFHHWKPSPYLLAKTMEYLPDQFYTVYGNHDLPQHSLELKHKSGIHVLEKANKLRVLNECSWGESPTNGFVLKNRRILIWHKMAYQKPPFPGATGGNAIDLLKQYPQFDLIVTGDNHQSFTQEYNGRLLVNPGSMMRQTVAQIEHIPCIYLWYAESNTVFKVVLTHSKDVITREHIVIKENKNNQLDAFISGLNDNHNLLSFEENLESHFTVNNIDKDIRKIIYKSLEI